MKGGCQGGHLSEIWPFNSVEIVQQKAKNR